MSSDVATHSAAHETADRPAAARRANAYHVLAMAFRTPAEWQPGSPSLLRRHFEPLGSPLRERAGETADAWEAALRDREQAAVDHARLFIGPFEVQAPPYASLYLDPERRLMGPVSQAAAHAYAEAGLAPGPARKEAPDHVAVELEFMYFLAFQEATTAEPEWTERQRRFWQSHLGRWLPELARRIGDADAHPFHAALAGLGACFADWESSFWRAEAGGTSRADVATERARGRTPGADSAG